MNAILADLLELKSRRVPSRHTAQTPSINNTKELAAVIVKPSRQVRRLNLQMFDELVAGMIDAHTDTARMEFWNTRARAAIGRMPVPILGPGMLHRQKRYKKGADNVANLFSIIVGTDRLLRTGRSGNAADAFVHAFSARMGCSLGMGYSAIVACAHECEFFDPAFVDLLLELPY